jgi:hypothetical protein
MNATQLFNQAKSKANQLPMIVKTPTLISAVMRAEIAQFIFNQDYDLHLGFDGDKAISILNTANEAMELVFDYMRKEIL